MIAGRELGSEYGQGAMIYTGSAWEMARNGLDKGV